jgi:hypothetical protein
MRRTAEFDSFGPWVDRVTAEEDVPRLYRSARVDPRGADLVLKVPRRISRRDATPDMDLYDHLVVVDAARVTLMSRRGGTFTTRTIPHEDVAVVSVSVDLLDGRLRISGARTADGDPISFRYNAVSQDAIDDLVRNVRERARGDAVPADGAVTRVDRISLGRRDLGPRDIDLVTELREAATVEPSLTPVAAHLRTTVRRRDGMLAGALDRVRPVTLHAAVVATSPGELHVVHRRRWFTTERKPTTSITRTAILEDRVTRFALHRSERYHGVREARVESGRTVTTLPVPADSPTAAAIAAVLEDTLRH